MADSTHFPLYTKWLHANPCSTDWCSQPTQHNVITWTCYSRLCLTWLYESLPWLILTSCLHRRYSLSRAAAEHQQQQLESPGCIQYWSSASFGFLAAQTDTATRVKQKNTLVYAPGHVHACTSEMQAVTLPSLCRQLHWLKQKWISSVKHLQTQTQTQTTHKSH